MTHKLIKSIVYCVLLALISNFAFAEIDFLPKRDSPPHDVLEQHHIDKHSANLKNNCQANDRHLNGDSTMTFCDSKDCCQSHCMGVGLLLASSSAVIYTQIQLLPQGSTPFILSLIATPFRPPILS
ncbi:Uncharacterised protein [Zhongshania aliphaticivorans]|uniref:CopL family metal-binding regulatory protein n=1 Tax=Zhongshania aliphaticivorans TaxID=1470434 RepID=A0A5S9NG49_9GAMM|nr:Uncharacterised protein [Zhongshania aliphaticivorans]CAA0095270.1 Uncharacterised protein [Zhongshania aliphaticivorans]